ncbi:hypothetical protein J2I47_12100 [Fibrella sp. HMF5335]|uniref:MetA-pathway of phenol degradation n=1 Tax=Fibrella rubiginis TaxID=2817060 RepID=A0A939GIC1_9BACT|nr:hypothetical protein [Fibrella rubiginis]MBO0937290.1 hypothetical protein [Fibrella rubiginis]
MVRCQVVLLLLLSPILAFAQQNLFNIPSGDITPKSKVFYQHQINLYTSRFESKGHFVYGLGNGWDAGVNVVGKGVYFRPNWQLMHNDQRAQGPLYPVVMGTLQKQLVLGEKVNLNLGTQVGTNFSSVAERRTVHQFTYGLLGYTLKPGKRLLAGTYVTNSAYVGPGNNLGLLLGYEWKLNDRWYLMGDWVSGRHDQAAGVAGVMYWPAKRVQFCGGLLLANPNVPKPNGIVLEINILGWNAGH